MTGKEAKDDAPGFDESLDRLEAIVAELEQGGAPLETSLDRYKEGVKLLESCRGRLASFRKQVEELTKDGDTSPFEGDPDVSDDPF